MNAAASVATRLRVYLHAIRFEHTIFALPFAYLGMVVAADGWPGWRTLFWISIAMVGARTGAMAANRLIDAEIDARNPRTAVRALPTGIMSRLEMLALAAAGFGLLHVAAWQLNILALALAPVAALFVTLYSYTKRFTWLSHWVLGTGRRHRSGGRMDRGAGEFSVEAAVLALVVTFWIAGFDVLYSLQDSEFDRQLGLRSVAERFGTRRALLIARSSHFLTIVFLAALGLIAPLSWPYWIGVILIAGLLAYEHALLRPDDLSKLDVAFFNLNGYVALTALAFTIAGVWIG